MIKLDFSYVKKDQLVNFADYKDKIKELDNTIRNKLGAGNDFLGWYSWPNDYDKEEVKRIKIKAQEFINNYDTLVVCGIGGSYLGANAVIDAINEGEGKNIWCDNLNSFIAEIRKYPKLGLVISFSQLQMSEIKKRNLVICAAIRCISLP